MVLTSELKGHCVEASRCDHANHVLQKCICTIPSMSAQFIIDELLFAHGGVVKIARHQCGCRVIQRLIEHCAWEQLLPLVEALLADCLKLSHDKFGNYVIQH